MEDWCREGWYRDDWYREENGAALSLVSLFAPWLWFVIAMIWLAEAVRPWLERRNQAAEQQAPTPEWDEWD